MSENPIKTGGPTKKRRPAYKGIIQQDVSQGKERVRAWPRPRGAPKTAQAKQLQDDFRQANLAAKYWDPRNIIEVDEWRKGTPVLIRDVQVALMYNRLLYFVLPDGRKLFPLVARQDMSDALDTIAQDVGSLLWRSADGWRMLAPPTVVGQIMVADDNKQPLWGSLPSGGNLNWWFPSRPLTTTFTGVQNNGTALVATNDPELGLVLDSGAMLNDLSHRLLTRVLTNPAGDWSILCRVTPSLPRINYSAFGLYAMRSASNRALVCTRWNDQTICANRMTLPTGNAALVGNTGLTTGTGQGVWMGISKVGTNINMLASGDGKHWWTHYTEAQATYLLGAPDKIGIGIYCQRAGGDHSIAAVDYWSATGI